MPLTSALRRRCRDFLIAGIIIRDKENEMSKNDSTADLNSKSLAELTQQYNSLVAESEKVEKFRNKAAAVKAIEAKMSEAAGAAAGEAESAAKRAPRQKANPDQKYGIAEGEEVEKSIKRMQKDSARAKVLNYIREHGPSTLGEMEHAGLEHVEVSVVYLVRASILQKVG